jgi:hypothetical protein
LETTITDLIEQRTKLNREFAAAVNHFTCILALSPMIAKCKTKLKTYRPLSNKARENLGKLLEYENRVPTSLMLTPRLWRTTATTSSTLKRATTRRS